MEIERLVEKHPGLICVYISCYGCDGPWKDWIGYDPNAQAATGIATTEGSPDAPLRAKSLILADYITGFLGAMGTLAALIHQSREGGSYSVNISLAQTCSWIQSLGTVDPTRVAEEEPPMLDRVDSVFGPLEFLAPVTQFSGLKAYWESPPVPLGSCKAEWLVRR